MYFEYFYILMIVYLLINIPVAHAYIINIYIFIEVSLIYIIYIYI